MTQHRPVRLLGRVASDSVAVEVRLGVAFKAASCSTSLIRPKRDLFRQPRGLLVQLPLWVATSQCRKAIDDKWHLLVLVPIRGRNAERHPLDFTVFFGPFMWIGAERVRGRFLGRWRRGGETRRVAGAGWSFVLRLGGAG